MKALIFDSSSIISLALNDLLYILEPLKKLFKGNFYITKTIKAEIIDRSIETKKFMFEALMLQKLIKKGVIEVFDDQLKKEKYLDAANNLFKVKGKPINLVHAGEASCLDLYNNLKTNQKAMVIDERTTRMLCENPENLRKLMEKKLRKKIKAKKENYSFFEGMNIIRSSELALIALNKKIINFSVPKLKIIEAMLYALKFKGCAISNSEINSLLH